MPRPSSLLLVGLSTTLILALGPPQAAAYVRTVTPSGKTAYWSQPCVKMVFHLGDPPPVLNADAYLLAAQRSAATWSREALACTDALIVIEPVEERDADVTGKDRVNRIVFRQDTWCRHPPPTDPREPPCYAQNALAITSVFTLESSGRIIDADMEVNAVHFSWGDLVDRADAPLGNRKPTVDLQNTLTHELGHVLGLDHPCSNDGSAEGVDDLGNPIPICSQAPSSMAETTMFPSARPRDVSLRDLAADDVNGVCRIYPATGAICRPGESGDLGKDGGGCAYGAHPGTGGLLTLLLVAAGMLGLGALASNRLRARWHTSTSSRCRISGASTRRTKRS